MYSKNDLEWPFEFGWPQDMQRSQPFAYSETLEVLPADKIVDSIQLLRFIEPADNVSMRFRDYINIIQTNLKGLNSEGQYLSKETFEFLHFGIPGNSVGWANEGEKDTRFSQNAGNTGYFFSRAMILPETDTAFVVITNKGEGKSAGQILKMHMQKFMN